MSESVALPLGSVIIPSHNRPELLRGCVESILNGSHVPAEIIIIDQSVSADPLLAEMRERRRGCQVRYHWTQVRGLSRAFNAGICLARFDVLVFAHDDVRVDARWYASIVSSLAQGGDGVIVTGRVLPERPNTVSCCVPSLKIEPFGRVYAGRIWEDVLYPMNMAMSRSTFELVGAFDERLGPGTPYPGAEDNDYGFRALERGCRNIYNPAAVVWHLAWRTDLVGVRWEYALGQGAFFAKHLAASDRYILRRVVRECALSARTAVSRAVRLDRQALSHAAASVGLVAGLITWRLRHRA